MSLKEEEGPVARSDGLLQARLGQRTGEGDPNSASRGETAGVGHDPKHMQNFGSSSFRLSNLEVGRGSGVPPQEAAGSTSAAAEIVGSQPAQLQLAADRLPHEGNQWQLPEEGDANGGGITELLGDLGEEGEEQMRKQAAAQNVGAGLPCEEAEVGRSHLMSRAGKDGGRVREAKAPAGGGSGGGGGGWGEAAGGGVEGAGGADAGSSGAGVRGAGGTEGGGRGTGGEAAAQADAEGLTVQARAASGPALDGSGVVSRPPLLDLPEVNAGPPGTVHPSARFHPLPSAGMLSTEQGSTPFFEAQQPPADADHPSLGSDLPPESSLVLLQHGELPSRSAESVETPAGTPAIQVLEAKVEEDEAMGQDGVDEDIKAGRHNAVPEELLLLHQQQQQNPPQFQEQPELRQELAGLPQDEGQKELLQQQEEPQLLLLHQQLLREGGGPCSCQVDGCGQDLAGVKEYYKRHRVCDLHSKASVVTVGGVQQRFCQQCSRFHDLVEFDQEKRSCRRRLLGHNKRRRKAHLNAAKKLKHMQQHQGVQHEREFHGGSANPFELLRGAGVEGGGGVVAFGVGESLAPSAATAQSHSRPRDSTGGLPEGGGVSDAMLAALLSQGGGSNLEASVAGLLGGGGGVGRGLGGGPDVQAGVPIVLGPVAGLGVGSPQQQLLEFAGLAGEEGRSLLAAIQAGGGGGGAAAGAEGDGGEASISDDRGGLTRQAQALAQQHQPGQPGQLGAHAQGGFVQEGGQQGKAGRLEELVAVLMVHDPAMLQGLLSLQKELGVGTHELEALLQTPQGITTLLRVLERHKEERQQRAAAAATAGPGGAAGGDGHPLQQGTSTSGGMSTGGAGLHHHPLVGQQATAQLQQVYHGTQGVQQQEGYQQQGYRQQQALEQQQQQHFERVGQQQGHSRDHGLATLSVPADGAAGLPTTSSSSSGLALLSGLQPDAVHAFLSTASVASFPQMASSASPSCPDTAVDHTGRALASHSAGDGGTSEGAGLSHQLLQSLTVDQLLQLLQSVSGQQAQQ